MYETQRICNKIWIS